MIGKQAPLILRTTGPISYIFLESEKGFVWKEKSKKLHGKFGKSDSFFGTGQGLVTKS